MLLVCPGFPADEADDRCIPPLQVMLRALVEQHPHLRLSVLAINYPARRDPYRWHGLEVGPLGGDNRRLPWRLAALRRGLAAARRVHRAHPVHLVHALWLGDAALLGRLVAWRMGVPMAATVMGQDALRSNRYLRWLPLAAMRLSAVSRRAATCLEESTGRRVGTVLPWGMDVPALDLPAWGQRPIDLLGVGSLTANKDYATFVRIVDRLRSEGRGLKAVIVGDGPQRSILEEQLRRSHLAGVVELRGAQSRAGVLETMRRSRILLHPAGFESFGFVFLEALAHGMALVSRPVGVAAEGPRWRVCDGEEALAAACIEMLDRPLDGGGLAPHPVDDSVAAWAAHYGLPAT